MFERYQNAIFHTFNKNQAIYALITHFSLIGISYTLFYFLCDGVHLPNDTNLLNWDAIWYYRIKELGYYYQEDQQGPLAFFPLFPFVWKFSTLNQQEISLLNLLIFSISFYVIAKQLAFDYLTSLIFLSTPSLLFCILPYTESFFFFGSMLILIGFEKNKNQYIIAGILIAGLTRAVNVTFIPSIIFTYVAIFGYKKSIVKPIVIQITIITIAIFGVFYLQYLYTGQWFAFFKMQKTWNRSLRIPTLPLTTMTGSKILWLDAIALFICLVAFFDTIKAAFNAFLYQIKSPWSPGTLFSMAYLSIIGFLEIFFSGVWQNEVGTSIMSINRYVFATPYFIYYIYNKFKKHQDTGSWIETSIALAIVILCLGGYQTLQGVSGYAATLLYFCTIAIYIATYIHFQNDKKILVLLYCVNAIVQVILINRFLSFGWVG